jgi:hypothetical protein
MGVVGVDNGLTQAQIDDGISKSEKVDLFSACNYPTGWTLKDASDQTDGSRTCDTVAKKYPEVNLRHGICYKSIRYAALGLGTDQDLLSGCNMYSDPALGGEIYPEYAKCLQPGGMDDPDCQRTCYTYPNQKGCELLTAGLTKADFVKRIRKLDFGQDPRKPSPPSPKPPTPKPKPPAPKPKPPSPKPKPPAPKPKPPAPKPKL